MFSSLTVSIHPLVRSSFCLKPVIFLIPHHTSLTLSFWSLLSSFFFYTSLPSFISTLSCFCILLNNSLSPCLKAFFFLLSWPFRMIQGLLLGKHIGGVVSVA
ncbi:hypothetical protein GOODEAATRI_033301 [Goodea atripinnis]|uniref:Uncharacterized protein n=1 Tax=Goodea atripinnis TaxID=208336 RepID=A0ABV0NFR9_9TELE